MENLEVEDELVSNDDLIKSLKDAGIADSLLRGKGSGLLRDMVDDISEQTLRSLCFQIDLGHQPSVIRLIERIRFLKYEFLPGLKKYIDTGKFSFEEARDRGLLTPGATPKKGND